MGKRKQNDQTMLWVAIGGGVLLLSFCCLGGVGVGAFLYLRNDSKNVAKGASTKSDLKQLPGGNQPQDKGLPKNNNVFVGKWEEEPRPPDLPPGFDATLEIRADGTLTDRTPLTPMVHGAWRMLPQQGNLIMLEFSNGNIIDRIEIRVIDNNHLHLRNLTDGFEMNVRRV
jgi:hypothetical protein